MLGARTLILISIASLGLAVTDASAQSLFNIPLSLPGAPPPPNPQTFLPPDADPYVVLKQLVGLDEHVVLHIGHEAIRAAFEPGRSTDEKISAVQYLRFPLTSDTRAALMTDGTEIVLEIDHPNYRHRVVCGEATRASLAADYA